MKVVATLPPMHPSEMLREGFLKPPGLSPYLVPAAYRARIERIAREELGITADTALRLGKFVGTAAGFWINLQKRYDLEVAEQAIGKELARIETYKQEAA